MKSKHSPLLSILLLATCSIILLLSACKETKSVEQSNRKSQPKQTIKALKLTKAYKNLTTDADTTCAGWHIILQSADAPYKVKNEDFYDKIVLITLYKNGKLLVDRQEITTKNLHKKPQPYLQLYPAWVNLITRTTAQIGINNCFPESDACWLYTLFYGQDGRMKKKVLKIEMDESDTVAEFFRSWIHECQLKPIDVSSLKMVANEFCLPNLAKQLDYKNWQKILPKKVVNRINTDIEVDAKTSFVSENYLTNRGIVRFYTHNFKQKIDSVHYELALKMQEDSTQTIAGISKIWHE